MRFIEKLECLQKYPIRAAGIDILQVNVGYRCNLACKHCHVQGGPDRQETMSRKTVEAVLDVVRSSGVRNIDITGGAPEMNPSFHYLVREAAKAGCRVSVRTNLAIFYEEGMEDLFDFYRETCPEVVASLPYYRGENVDRVRGQGVFEKSISALRMLNSFGYGTSEDRTVHLVYNPPGAFLPSAQTSLEADYKKELKEGFGISFNNLFVFANMPIGRYYQFLMRSGNFERYMQMLADAFNPETLCGLMCRQLLNVGWDGRLYDCDFNQMIGLGILEGFPSWIGDYDREKLSSRTISVGDHCYGCTAGQGST